MLVDHTHKSDVKQKKLIDRPICDHEPMRAHQSKTPR